MQGATSRYWDGFWRRRVTRRVLLRGVAYGGIGLASAVLVGCGGDRSTATGTRKGSGSGAGRVGGIVQIRASGNFSGLEPVQGTGGTDHQFLWTVYDNLIGYDASMKAQPGRSLAESWEAPDGERFIFHLRDGVVFHDGTPFSSEAVRRNWEWGLTPNIRSNVVTDLKPILNVEAPDNWTAVYRLDGPYAPLPKIWGDRPGMMISPTAIDKYGPEVTNHPVGTGAFVFREQVLDSYVLVERNPRYWQPEHPFVDAVRWRIVPDEDAALNGFRSGEFNLFWNFPPRAFRSFQATRGFTALEKEGVLVDMIYLNSVRPPLNNVHARRAIAHAINRQLLTETILEGFATPANSFMGPGNEEYDPDQEGFSYDPRLAREELSRAGLGSGFRFSLTVQNTPQAMRVGEAIQSQLAEVGITAELRQLPAPDYYLKFIQEQQGDAFIAAFSGRVDPWQTLNFLFASDGTYGKAGTQQKDDAINRTLARARGTYDYEERVRLYREVDRHAMEQAYGIPLWYPRTLVVMVDDLELEVFGDGKPHLGQGDVRFTA